MQDSGSNTFWLYVAWEITFLSSVVIVAQFFYLKSRVKRFNRLKKIMLATLTGPISEQKADQPPKDFKEQTKGYLDYLNEELKNLRQMLNLTEEGDIVLDKDNPVQFAVSIRYMLLSAEKQSIEANEDAGSYIDHMKDLFKDIFLYIEEQIGVEASGSTDESMDSEEANIPAPSTPSKTLQAGDDYKEKYESLSSEHQTLQKQYEAIVNKLKGDALDESGSPGGGSGKQSNDSYDGGDAFAERTKEMGSALDKMKKKFMTSQQEKEELSSKYDQLNGEHDKLMKEFDKLKKESEKTINDLTKKLIGK